MAIKATHRTWNGRPSPCWQHNEPLSCPRDHVMGWLGGAYWLCTGCIYANGATRGVKTGGTIYVQRSHD
jgi:hypothetical protein